MTATVHARGIPGIGIVTPNPPSARMPIATLALCLAQIVAWVAIRRYLLVDGDWRQFAMLPGAPASPGLLISSLVHLDALHLGANVTVLWAAGRTLEPELGGGRFFAVYWGSAWFAALMQWAVFQSFHVEPGGMHETAAVVGSSGAVAGVLGTILVRHPHPDFRLPLAGTLRIPIGLLITAWAAYAVVRALTATSTGVAAGLGHWAHFAGIVAGLAAGHLLRLDRMARQDALARAADRAFALEDYQSGSVSLGGILAENPRDLDRRLTLVQARLALGDEQGGRRVAVDGLAVCIQADDRERALDWYVTVERLFPDLALPPGVRFRLGTWLADGPDPEAAERALLRCAEDEPGTETAAAALFRAGQLAWERRQDTAAARATWTRLLEQHPDSPWCDQARARLRSGH